MAMFAAASAAEPAVDTFDDVVFVNPDAAVARSRRRVKLDATRARIATLTANGEGAFSAGSDGANSEKELRKQQRMLRNRESAALSRKRKSDRIGELELEVEALKEENRRLRQRIDGPDGGTGSSGFAAASKRPANPLGVAARAPTNTAEIAAPPATSIVIPPITTTTVIPSSPPPPLNDTDLFHHSPDALAATATATTAPTCSALAAALYSSSSAFAKNCSNIISISRPAVFA